jgi:hypothetical protein
VPVPPHHEVRADVPAALESLKSRACDLGKFLRSLVGHVRIVLSMEHQHLGAIDLVSVLPRIVEGTASKVAPVRI